MDRGIVLLSFGSPVYGKLAFNLALTLKLHSPIIPIHLVHDDRSLSHLTEKHLSFFDSFATLKQEDYYRNGRIDPALAKVRIYNYLPYTENIFLDTDAAAIKDITPLFGGRYFETQIVATQQGIGEFKDMPWADTKDIWAHYKLKEDTILPATNSSFAYIRKSKKAEQFYLRLEKNMDFPLEKLKVKWGGTFPDELALNATLAQLGISDGKDAVLFSQKFIKPAEAENYYLISIYGATGFTHKSVVDWYDRVIHSASMKLIGKNQEFKAHTIIGKKHANQRI